MFTINALTRQCLLRTHPSIEGISCVGGLDEVLKLDDAVGHKVIISDGSIVKDCQLDLFPVAHVEAELLVERRCVGFLFGESLSNFRVVYLHHNVGVQAGGGFVEDDRVA